MTSHIYMHRSMYYVCRSTMYVEVQYVTTVMHRSRCKLSKSGKKQRLSFYSIICS